MGGFFSTPVDTVAEESAYNAYLEELAKADEEIKKNEKEIKESEEKEARLRQEIADHARVQREKLLAEQDILEQKVLYHNDRNKINFMNTSTVITEILFNNVIGVVDLDDTRKLLAEHYKKYVTEDVFWLMSKIPVFLPLIWPTGEGDEKFHERIDDPSKYYGVFNSLIGAYVKDKLVKIFTNVSIRNLLYDAADAKKQTTERTNLVNRCQKYKDEAVKMESDQAFVNLTVKFLNENYLNDYYNYRLLRAMGRKGISSKQVLYLPPTYPKYCNDYEYKEAVVMLVNLVVNRYGAMLDKNGNRSNKIGDIVTHGGKCFARDDATAKKVYELCLKPQMDALSKGLWDGRTYMNASDIVIGSSDNLLSEAINKVFTIRSDKGSNFALDSTVSISSVSNSNQLWTTNNHSQLIPVDNPTMRLIIDKAENSVRPKLVTYKGNEAKCDSLLGRWKVTKSNDVVSLANTDKGLAIGGDNTCKNGNPVIMWQKSTAAKNHHKWSMTSAASVIFWRKDSANNGVDDSANSGWVYPGNYDMSAYIANPSDRTNKNNLLKSWYKYGKNSANTGVNKIGAVCNDDVASVTINPGTDVYIYENGGFKGKCLHLHNGKNKAWVYNLSTDGMKDKLSSYKIMASALDDKQTREWNEIAPTFTSTVQPVAMYGIHNSYKEVTSSSLKWLRYVNPFNDYISKVLNTVIAEEFEVNNMAGLSCEINTKMYENVIKVLNEDVMMTDYNPNIPATNVNAFLFTAFDMISTNTKKNAEMVGPESSVVPALSMAVYKIVVVNNCAWTFSVPINTVMSSAQINYHVEKKQNMGVKFCPQYMFARTALVNEQPTKQTKKGFTPVSRSGSTESSVLKNPEAI